MTAQISESIKYKDKKRSLLNCPLCHYFSLANIESPFQGNCTALWRGYTGNWEIVNDRLYLTSVKAGFDDDNNTALEDIFSGFGQRVFAHWYTGELRIPVGKQLKYVHMGFASEYKQEVYLQVDQGVVISERVENNK
jgi:hypothetical protein